MPLPEILGLGCLEVGGQMRVIWRSGGSDGEVRGVRWRSEGGQMEKWR